MIKSQFNSFCRLNQNQPNFSTRLIEIFGEQLLDISKKPPLIWFEANACSGDSISTLNVVKPGLGQILCSFLEIRYWNALMPDQGSEAVQRLFDTVESGDFLLVVEGAIAQGKYAE